MKINKPRGTRDFLPEDTRKRRYIENKLRQTAIRWGYNEIKTPTFEHIELFTLKSGEGILGEIYNFKDKGDREIALRPELTAPVLRLYVSELQRAPRPIKLYYFDNCFRYERPQKGRFREFWQFGAEIIGSPRPEADAEVIALACRMLSEAGVDGDLHVGHLGIIRTLFEGLDTETQGQIMRLVDKKDDKGLEDYLEEIDADIEMREKLSSVASERRYQELIACTDHRFPEGKRRRWLQIAMGCNMGIEYYPDMFALFQVLPLGTDKTLIKLARYSPPNLSAEEREMQQINLALLEEVNNQDKVIVERIQQGVRSAGYRPGPLALEEDAVYRFHEELREKIPVTRLSEAPLRGTLQQENERMKASA